MNMAFQHIHYKTINFQNNCDWKVCCPTQLIPQPKKCTQKLNEKNYKSIKMDVSFFWSIYVCPPKGSKYWHQTKIKLYLVGTNLTAEMLFLNIVLINNWKLTIRGAGWSDNIGHSQMDVIKPKQEKLNKLEIPHW